MQGKIFEDDDLDKYLYGTTANNASAFSWLAGNSASAQYNRHMRLRQALDPSARYYFEDGTLYDPSQVSMSHEGHDKVVAQIVEDARKAGADIEPYVTGNVEGLRQALDYVYKNGYYNSYVGEELRKVYGDEESMTLIRQSEYGRYLEAIEALPEIVAFLNATGKTNTTVDEVLNSPAVLSGIEQYAIEVANSFSEPYKVLADSFAKYIESQEQNGGTAGSITQTAMTYFGAADLSSVSDSVIESLKKSGLIFAPAELEGSAAGQYAQLTIDPTALAENIRGALFSASFDLSELSLSADDVTLLAKAGIQINADGTVQMMYAGSAATSGAERTWSLSKEDVAEVVNKSLSKSGISIDYDTSELNFGDFATVADEMTSAVFALPESVQGRLTLDIKDALSAVGVTIDDEFIQITNKAILQGNKSLAAVIAGLDWDNVDKTTRDQIEKIAKFIDGEGDEIQNNIIEWANGITIPSPVAFEDLSAYIVQAFREAGISFQVGAANLTAEEQRWAEEIGVSLIEGTSKLQMVISNTGDALANGTQLLDAEDWYNLVGPDEAKTAVGQLLEELGVTWKEKGGIAAVDISDAMSKSAEDMIAAFVDRPEAWDQLPAAVQEAFGRVIMETDTGMLAIMNSIDTNILQIGDAWAVAWEGLTEETQQALNTLGFTVQSGVVTFKGYLIDGGIPETVNRELLVPFQELPEEIQEQLRQTDENCEEKLYDLSTTVETETGGIADTFSRLMESMITAADDMSTAVSDSMAAAISSINDMLALQNAAGGSIFADYSVSTKGVTRGGITYYEVYNPETGATKAWEYKDEASGRVVKLDKKEAQALNLEWRANGGTVSGATTLAGELGTEMALLPDGSTELLDAGLYNLPVGTQILTAEETEMVRKYAGDKPHIQSYAQGSAQMSTFMPSDAKYLADAIGIMKPQDSYETEANLEGIIDKAVNQIVSVILPAIVGAQQTDQLPPMYVGTLVADDTGLRQLERKLDIIRQSEGRRR